MSKILLGLATSTFTAGLSYYLSTVYGVGLDWTDVLTYVVESIKGTLPLQYQGVANTLVALLFVIGTWEGLNFAASVIEAGWTGLLVFGATLEGTFALFLGVGMTQALVYLGLFMIILGYVAAYLFRPESLSELW